MPITLYMDYMSQPSRAVLALCLLAHIPHQIKQIRISLAEMRSEQYRKINPMARVPAIVDNDTNFKLAESHTIMKYLCRKYPQYVGDWYPINDSMKIAKIDQYLDFHHTNTRKCAFYIFNSLFAKNMGIPTDPQFIQPAAKKDIQRALKLISNHYLSSTNYITGNKPTIADLSAYYQIQFLMLVGQNFQQWPKIKSWLDRMGQIKEVKDANKVFLKVIGKNSAKL